LTFIVVYSSERKWQEVKVYKEVEV